MKTLDEKEKIVLEHITKAREIAHRICDIEVAGNYADIDIMVALVSMQKILEKDKPGMTESAHIIIEGARQLRMLAEEENAART